MYLGLLGFFLLLFTLSLGDSSCPFLIADFSSLVPPCSNEVQISTDDATLVLDGTARTLLGNLLCDALLVHPTEYLSPSDFARIFPLGEERSIFRGFKTKDLMGRNWNQQGETESAIPCCHRERKACLYWGRYGSLKRSRSLASKLARKGEVGNSSLLA